MYKETFIISFAPGSSGKFIANIIWNMYQNFSIESTSTMFNSWHGSSNFYHTTNELAYINYTGINYKNITWGQYEADNPHLKIHNPANIGLFYTHIFPKIDDIQNNRWLDNTKFIVIRAHQDSLLETIGNSVYKNEIQRHLGGNINFGNSNEEWLYHEYVKEFGYVHEKDFKNILRTDKEGIQTLIKNIYDHTIDNIQQGYDAPPHRLGFLNCNVPEQIKERTLVIDYLDLFQKTDAGYLALDMITEFTNKNPSDQIKFRYEEYVNGRTQFIKDHLYNLVPLI